MCWESELDFPEGESTNDTILQPNTDPKIDAPTIGTALLKSRNLFVEERWYWISIAALLGFSLVYNVCFLAALKYLNRKPLTAHQSFDNSCVRRSTNARVCIYIYI